jgi:hypothetical protein
MILLSCELELFHIMMQEQSVDSSCLPVSSEVSQEQKQSIFIQPSRKRHLQKPLAIFAGSGLPTPGIMGTTYDILIGNSGNVFLGRNSPVPPLKWHT